MTVTIGSAFTPTPTVQPDPDGRADAALLAALQGLTDKVAALAIPPATVEITTPPVVIPKPRPGPSAEQIGAAVAAALPSDDDSKIVGALDAVQRSLDRLAKQTGAPKFGTGGGLGGAAFDATGNLKVVVSGGASSGLTNTELRATPVPVSGTVSTGLSQPLTDTQLRATPVPMSGTVSVSNFPATQPVSIASTVPVSGTFWQATQPVSGPLTDTQLRASAVPVSGTVTANAGTGTMAVSGPLTDTQLRAAAVAVTGSGTAGTPAAGVQTVQGITNGTPQNVMQAAIVKGTQGANGVTTQDLKDAGRSAKTMLAAFVSTALAETAINFQVSTAGGVPAAAAASYTVTAGKTLRIQTIVAQIRAGGTTPAASLATFKIKVGGNQQGQAFMVAAPTTVAAGPSAFVGMLSGLNFPDGWELAAGAVLSFTLTLSAWTTAVNTPTVDLTVVGYEY